MAWPTTEHYFQAQKFVGTPYEEVIRQLTSPREAFDFSRKPEVSYWRRNDWEQVKEDVMHKALLAKFTQYELLNRLLLDTGNCILVEHTRNDSYWGDGGDGTGKNRLGNLLMKVRETLRTPKVLPLPPAPPQPMTAMPKQIHHEQMQSKCPPLSPPHNGENHDNIHLMGDASTSSAFTTTNDEDVDNLLRMSESQPTNMTIQNQSSASVASTASNYDWYSPTMVTSTSVIKSSTECSLSQSFPSTFDPSSFMQQAASANSSTTSSTKQSKPSLVGSPIPLTISSSNGGGGGIYSTRSPAGTEMNPVAMPYYLQTTSASSYGSTQVSGSNLTTDSTVEMETP